MTAKKLIKELLNIKEIKTGSLYLGNSLLLGRSKIKEFGRLMDKLQTRLEGWKCQLLSRADKATLIRSVAQSLPVYTMSTFKVPVGVCKELDSVLRRFWLGKERNLWKPLGRPREEICLDLKKKRFKISTRFYSQSLAGRLPNKSRVSRWTYSELIFEGDIFFQLCSQEW